MTGAGWIVSLWAEEELKWWVKSGTLTAWDRMGVGAWVWWWGVDRARRRGVALGLVGICGGFLRMSAGLAAGRVEPLSNNSRWPVRVR